eukprot:gnl/TRDRNA2_/TRDRNA2_187811_c0_seq1.p1 gnl/TRDRNA2_/TRDRNA2_187811_c0~~gnl/TRDRNA2_/TRDRNA2_187811_c0_seq1.p1  ORF type:complete len:835 (-),score=114.72 gnl/TRDRNA2_/TRDRNA2_187811_c0_seq1:162-2393(-)
MAPTGAAASSSSWSPPVSSRGAEATSTSCTRQNSAEPKRHEFSVFRDLYDDALRRVQKKRELQAERETKELQEAENQRRAARQQLQKRQQSYLKRPHSAGHIQDGFAAHIGREAEFQSRRQNRRQRQAQWLQKREEFEEMAECTFQPNIHTRQHHRELEKLRKDQIEEERKYIEDAQCEGLVRSSSCGFNPANVRRVRSSERSESASATELPAMTEVPSSEMFNRQGSATSFMDVHGPKPEHDDRMPIHWPQFAGASAVPAVSASWTAPSMSVDGSPSRSSPASRLRPGYMNFSQTTEVPLQDIDSFASAGGVPCKRKLSMNMSPTAENSSASIVAPSVPAPAGCAPDAPTRRRAVSRDSSSRDLHQPQQRLEQPQLQPQQRGRTASREAPGALATPGEAPGIGDASAPPSSTGTPICWPGAPPFDFASARAEVSSSLAGIAGAAPPRVRGCELNGPTLSWAPGPVAALSTGTASPVTPGLAAAADRRPPMPPHSWQGSSSVAPSGSPSIPASAGGSLAASVAGQPMQPVHAVAAGARNLQPTASMVPPVSGPAGSFVPPIGAGTGSFAPPIVHSAGNSVAVPSGPGGGGSMASLAAIKSSTAIAAGTSANPTPRGSGITRVQSPGPPGAAPVPPIGLVNIAACRGSTCPSSARGLAGASANLSPRCTQAAPPMARPLADRTNGPNVPAGVAKVPAAVGGLAMTACNQLASRGQVPMPPTKVHSWAPPVANQSSPRLPQWQPR